LARTINKVTLLGNLGRAPEVRATNGGTTVAQFSLATVNRFKDGQGNWQEATEWHNCVAFGKLAEIIRDYVDKGSKLYLEGRLQTRSWDDKETGAKKYRTEIVVAEVTLLGSPQGKQPASDGDDAAQYAAAYAHRGPVATSESTITDDDIPF
jgi:single-strand DNA-binding protein